MYGDSVLVVDDDRASLDYMSLALEEAGHSVRRAENGIQALLAIEREIPALVISDLQMPGMGGLDLLTHIKERWPAVQVVMVTVETDIVTVVEVVQRGALNYLVKPVAPSVLQATASRVLSRISKGSTEPPAGSATEIIGGSPAIVRVRHTVALASRSDVNVIVVGETGTGKELVARAVHRLSSLATGPFIAHNCAVTSTEMFDSEFFGHRRGAFTGADRDRPGILREADGGVLFLDELECLSLPNQAKLLRVLDDGEIRPVGSEQSRPVSVRFVAATNRGPDAMIASKEFREDLYYRLRGFQIELPPLRERLEDIPLLAEHFLASPRSRLTSRALETLAEYSWPGNVRQLRNVLRSAAAVAGAQSIDNHHLDLMPASNPRMRASPARASEPPIEMTLGGAERQVIEQALNAHGWNLSRAAEVLGIHRSTLRRKIRELGLDRARG